MAAPINKPSEAETEDWLVTYADAITLLMAFFVMMLTFAEFDIPAYQEAVEAIKAQVGNKEKEDSPVQTLKLDVEDVVYNMQADQVVTVSIDDKGVIIELASSAFYKSGTAQFREQAKPVLEKIALTLSAPKYRLYTIEAEGHTDDDPINTPIFPSNWELSAGRAAGVVRMFEAMDLDSGRMIAEGFADTQPKVPNREEDGSPIKENQATNRRVVIRVFPMNLNDQEKYFENTEIRQIGKAPPPTEAPAEAPTTDAAPATDAMPATN